MLNEVSVELYLDVLNGVARQEVVTLQLRVRRPSGVAGATVLAHRLKTPQGIILLNPSLGPRVW
ncbi:MAG: hypothetical protein IPJ65_39030 [Archangiaceae bacterium]|nr:hypothetical protein [Archangiaceae bacterium]